MINLAPPPFKRRHFFTLAGPHCWAGPSTPRVKGPAGQTSLGIFASGNSLRPVPERSAQRWNCTKRHLRCPQCVTRSAVISPPPVLAG
jgi:hypothetical protein